MTLFSSITADEYGHDSIVNFAVSLRQKCLDVVVDIRWFKCVVFSSGSKAERREAETTVTTGPSSFALHSLDLVVDPNQRCGKC